MPPKRWEIQKYNEQTGRRKRCGSFTLFLQCVNIIDAADNKTLERKVRFGPRTVEPDHVHTKLHFRHRNFGFNQIYWLQEHELQRRSARGESLPDTLNPFTPERIGIVHSLDITKVYCLAGM